MKPLTVFKVKHDERENEAILNDWVNNYQEIGYEYEIDENYSIELINRINKAYELLLENRFENQKELDGSFPLGNESDMAFAGEYFNIKEIVQIQYGLEHLVFDGYYSKNDFDGLIRKGFLLELAKDYLGAVGYYEQVPSAVAQIRAQLCKSRNEKQSSKFYNEALMLSRDGKSKEAFAKFLEAASFGNASAQTRLGVMLAKGIGVTQDLDEALKYLKLAAEAGDSDACNVIVELYDSDVIDIEGLEAMHYCECAATDSNQARRRILQGFDLRPKVEILREKAIWHDDAKAMFLLYKRLVNTEREEALSWLEKAVDLEYISALLEKAEMIILSDAEKATNLYMRAANLGSAQACIALGDISLENADCSFYEATDKSNTTEHMRQFNWYLKAAELGYVPAMSYISEAYLNGYPISKNIDEAFYWASRGADANDYYAHYLIGRISESSDENDMLTAIIFYTQAAEKGVLKAIDRLYEIYSNGEKNIKKDTKKAKHYQELKGKIEE